MKTGKSSRVFSQLSVTKSPTMTSRKRVEAVYKGQKVAVYSVDKTELNLV